MSIIVIGIRPGFLSSLAEINGGRRGVIFLGDPDVMINTLDTRLAELHNQDHQMILACEEQKYATAHATTAKICSLAGYYGIRLSMQQPGSERLIAEDELIQRAGLWTLCSEVDDKEHPTLVNNAMRHALLAMSRYFPEHFDSIMAYAKGDPIS